MHSLLVPYLIGLLTLLVTESTQTHIQHCKCGYVLASYVHVFMLVSDYLTSHVTLFTFCSIILAALLIAIPFSLCSLLMICGSSYKNILTH